MRATAVRLAALGACVDTRPEAMRLTVATDSNRTRIPMVIALAAPFAVYHESAGNGRGKAETREFFRIAVFLHSGGARCAALGIKILTRSQSESP